MHSHCQCPCPYPFARAILCHNKWRRKRNCFWHCNRSPSDVFNIYSDADGVQVRLWTFFEGSNKPFSYQIFIWNVLFQVSARYLRIIGNAVTWQFLKCFASRSNRKPRGHISPKYLLWHDNNACIFIIWCMLLNCW